MGNSGINKSLPLVATVLGILGCGGCDDSTSIPSAATSVFTGQFGAITESVGIFVWGDNPNHLCQQWSIAKNDQSGWFYGTNFPWSSADVYVLPAPNDPLAIVAAENLAFTQGTLEAFEGDTVFFRGRNGFFGAWTIEEIAGREDALISGTWYFKSGGGGNFTGDVVNGGTSNYDPDVGVCDGF
jgi:hypothetical protein